MAAIFHKLSFILVGHLCFGCAAVAVVVSHSFDVRRSRRRCKHFCVCVCVVVCTYVDLFNIWRVWLFDSHCAIAQKHWLRELSLYWAMLTRDHLLKSCTKQMLKSSVLLKCIKVSVLGCSVKIVWMNVDWQQNIWTLVRTLLPWPGNEQ